MWRTLSELYKYIFQIKMREEKNDNLDFGFC